MTTKFGRYELLERISVGGMAEVFKGRVSGAAGFEKIVAIKRILPNLSDDQDFIDMFVDEAKISAHLNHSNIGQVFEFGKADGRYFIAMEYIHGKDCRRIQEYFRSFKKAMPVPMAVRIVLEVCAALEYAHGKRDELGRPLGIVHRDISPQNILISYEGAVKVIDFGIAKALSRSTKTSTGNLKGKYSYMSPEQAEGGEIDGRSDIFAVGTVLYELVTGQRLFDADNELATLELVRKAEVPPPSRANPTIHKGLEAIILKALARRATDRFQKAEELHEALDRFAQTARVVFGTKQLSQWMKSTFGSEQERPEARPPADGLVAPASLGRSPSPEAAAPPRPGAPSPQLTVRGRAPVPAGLPGRQAVPLRPAPSSRPLASPRPRPPAPAPRPGASASPSSALADTTKNPAMPERPASPAGGAAAGPADKRRLLSAPVTGGRPTMWGLGLMSPPTPGAARPRMATPMGPHRPAVGPTQPLPEIRDAGGYEDQEETRVSPETAALASRLSQAGSPAGPTSPAEHRRAAEDPLRKTILDPNLSRPKAAAARDADPTLPSVPPRMGLAPEPGLGAASEAEVNESSDTLLQQEPVQEAEAGPHPASPTADPADVRRPVEVVIPGDRLVDSQARTLVPGELGRSDVAGRLQHRAARPAPPAPELLADDGLDDGPTVIDPRYPAAPESRLIEPPFPGAASSRSGPQDEPPLAVEPQFTAAVLPEDLGAEGLVEEEPSSAGLAAAEGEGFDSEIPTRSTLTGEPSTLSEQPVAVSRPQMEASAAAAAEPSKAAKTGIRWGLLAIGASVIVVAVGLAIFVQLRIRGGDAGGGAASGLSPGSGLVEPLPPREPARPERKPGGGQERAPGEAAGSKDSPGKAGAGLGIPAEKPLRGGEPKEKLGPATKPSKKTEPEAEPRPKLALLAREPKKAEPALKPRKKVEPKKKAEPALEPRKKVEPQKKAEPALEPRKKVEPKKTAEPALEPRKKVEPKKKAEPSDPKKMGALAVSSRPWARVFIDGKDTGRNTPIPPASPLRLNAGPHKVILEVGKQRFTFTVNIKAGETATLVKILPVGP